MMMMMTSFARLFGDGIFSADGDDWYFQRKVRKDYYDHHHDDDDDGDGDDDHLDDDQDRHNEDG